MDHLIDVHARAHDLKTPGGKARFVDAVIPVLRNLPALMREPYLQRSRRCRVIDQGALSMALRGGWRAAAEGRFTADAVIRAADALPVNDILRGVSRTEQELLRLVLLVPEPHDGVLDGLGPDRLPSQVARELYRAIVIARARDDSGVRPPFALAAVLDGLDDESRALGQALVSRSGPDPRELGDRALAYETERLILELDDTEWHEQSSYNRDAMAEAERDTDHDLIERLTLERRLLNEQRRSLDRRRDQTRLLARRAAVAATHSNHQPTSPPTQPDRIGGLETMADPLDKQLVEAVLASHPRRTRRELEEAKLATMRPRRGAAAAPSRPPPRYRDAEDSDDQDEDEDRRHRRCGLRAQRRGRGRGRGRGGGTRASRPGASGS